MELRERTRESRRNSHGAREKEENQIRKSRRKTSSRDETWEETCAYANGVYKEIKDSDNVAKDYEDATRSSKKSKREE